MSKRKKQKQDSSFLHKKDFTKVKPYQHLSFEVEPVKFDPPPYEDGTERLDGTRFITFKRPGEGFGPSKARYDSLSSIHKNWKSYWNN